LYIALVHPDWTKGNKIRPSARWRLEAALSGVALATDAATTDAVKLCKIDFSRAQEEK